MHSSENGDFGSEYELWEHGTCLLVSFNAKTVMFFITDKYIIALHLPSFLMYSVEETTKNPKQCFSLSYKIKSLQLNNCTSISK